MRKVFVHALCLRLFWRPQNSHLLRYDMWRGPQICTSLPIEANGAAALRHSPEKLKGCGLNVKHDFGS